MSGLPPMLKATQGVAQAKDLEILSYFLFLFSFYASE